MKKFTLYCMLLLGSICLIPSQMMAKEVLTTTIENNPKEISPEVKIMLDRLDEIKAMDKSNLSRSEKKALRKEVKTISATMRSSNNGVYLSVGAIIIIVLLLILIL